MYTRFNLSNLELTKYLFFTGKGGVGKTSLSASVAINLADNNKKVLLVSTDPASNLQDIFKTNIGNRPQAVKDVKNLFILNLDPEQAAKEYKESVLSQYRGILPDNAIQNMDEQLSGSCTVEIAAFNQFSSLLTEDKIRSQFDHIIFDTAPTGHTLRMLELPAAWNGYIENTSGNASCLGQLSGLTDKKKIYEIASNTLKDKSLTAIYLVTRPQKLAINELIRTSKELQELNINNQVIILNYVLEKSIKEDKLSESFFNNQQTILNNLPKEIENFQKYISYLMPFNIVGIENIRNLISEKKHIDIQLENVIMNTKTKDFDDLIDDLIKTNKRIIFTMGKGGVGKSTIASDIAKELSKRSKKVHLTTTDPASHLKYLVEDNRNLRVTEINPKVEVERYRNHIISEAQKDMSQEQIDYIKEDLMSPCTEEIAVFKAFADIVAAAGEEIVIIDTAPTGHTLLLLDASQSYAREAARAARQKETSITKLLPRLRDKNYTEILIVTLPEATPYFESVRLKEDLFRAGIINDTFVINNVMVGIKTQDQILKTRSNSEVYWINKIIDEIPNVYLVNYKLS